MSEDDVVISRQTLGTIADLFSAVGQLLVSIDSKDDSTIALCYQLVMEQVDKTTELFLLDAARNQ